MCTSAQVPRPKSLGLAVLFGENSSHLLPVKPLCQKWCLSQSYGVGRLRQDILQWWPS